MRRGNVWSAAGAAHVSFIKLQPSECDNINCKLKLTRGEHSPTSKPPAGCPAGRANFTRLCAIWDRIVPTKLPIMGGGNPLNWPRTPIAFFQLNQHSTFLNVDAHCLAKEKPFLPYTYIHVILGTCAFVCTFSCLWTTVALTSNIFRLVFAYLAIKPN